MLETKKAFTLIELLVVISIIAVLMAVMMPSLNKARESAKVVLCKSNIRQFGIGLQMYVTDHDDKFPCPLDCMYNETKMAAAGLSGGKLCRWHEEAMNPVTKKPEFADGVTPYLKSAGIMLCPTFKSLAKRYGAMHPNHNPRIEIVPQYSYSMNWFLGFKDEWEAYGGYKGVKKLSQVKRPSEIFSFGEENMWLITAGEKGATESLTTSVLNDNVLMIVDDSYSSLCDKVGSFHFTTSGKLSCGKGDVVFLDGSVGSISPKDSFKYAYPFRDRRDND